MSWLTEPDSDWDAPDPEDEPRSRLRLVALLLGAWLAVSVVVLIVLLLVGGHHSSNPSASATGSNSPSGPTSGASASAGAVPVPAGWTKQAADQQTNCAAHSYGQVAAFFARTPCTSVSRLLATTTTGGRTIVIASNIVTFPSESQAKSYLALVNADGTGNISDLLREGVRYPGSPTSLPSDAAFASRQDSNTVHVAEAAFVAGTSSGGDPTLQATAKQGI